MKHRKYAYLYLAVSCFYVLTGSGRIGGMDALSLYRVEINIADSGNVRGEPCDPAHSAGQCVPGVDGHFYSPYGLLPSLLAAPTYIFAKIVTRFLHVPVNVTGGFFTMLLTELAAAVVPVAIAWWAELMGYSWGAACFAAIALGFGTPFWFYGVKQFFSEPYMTLPLLLSAILMLHAKDRRWLAAAGFFFGLSASARIIACLVLPLYLLVLLWQRYRSSKRWGDILSFLAPLGFMLLLVGIFNFTRFGSFTKTGYHWTYPSMLAAMTVPLWTGLWNYIVVPDNSLLYFAPLVVLAPWSLVLLYRKNPYDAVLAAGAFTITIVFFSMFIDGHPPWCYGPRYLVPSLPFLFVPLCALWDWLKQESRWLRVAVVALFAVSIAIHVVGTIYPLSLYYWRQGWVSAREGHPVYPGIIPSMFSELPQVIANTSRVPHSRGIADPQAETQSLPAASYPDFDSLVQSLPNPINVVAPDLWLVKFAVLMHAPWLCALLACLLLAAGGWFLTKGLAGASP